MIDKKFGFSTSAYNIEFKFLLHFVSSLMYSKAALLFYYFCDENFHDVPFYLIFIFECPFLVSHSVIVVFTILFYSVYCRMLCLTNLTLNYTNGNSSCQHAYLELADLMEERQKIFGCMYFWCIMFHVADIMLALFNALNIVDLSSVNPFSLNNNAISLMWQNIKVIMIAMAINVIPIFLLILAPIYTANLLSSQVNKLKIVLMDRLLHERDKDHYVALDKFICYIEARPFRYTIADIIPLEWTLVSIVLKIMSTYIIVLLQMH
nr:uncharacterized protein LOC128678334 [Plodia interpunctella]